MALEKNWRAANLCGEKTSRGQCTDATPQFNLPCDAMCDPGGMFTAPRDACRSGAPWPEVYL